MKKGDNLKFRLEPCGDPPMWYMVEDGGQHDKPITQCVSRCATAEETALWLELFPKAEPIRPGDLSILLVNQGRDLCTSAVERDANGELMPCGDPGDEQPAVEKNEAPTAEELLASRTITGVGTITVDRGDLTDAELEKLTAPGV